MSGIPSYSVVIPAYNEEKFLPQTLQRLASAMSGVQAAGEVIVVDNNSDDATGELALRHGARLVREPINQISRARNTGAAAASGKALIFLDADTWVDVAVITNALAALESGAVCGGGARVAIEHTSRIANGAVACWNMIARLTGLAAGCFIFVRRDAFEEIGGFSHEVYASEEIWLSLALKRWGRRREQGFKILEESVVTSARKAEWLSATQMFKQIAVFLVFPFAVRSKRWCGAWYDRRGDTRK